MMPFFAIGDAHTAAKYLAGRNVLFSFAYVGTRWLAADRLAEACANASEVMIDSGAFTAWKQGKPIALEEYTQYLLERAPSYSWAIALDTIGDEQASVDAYLRMRAEWPLVSPRPVSQIVPVWHEGDSIESLDEYVRRAELVGIGRIAGRRSEQKTFEFYDDAFNRHPDAKFHALGNANPVQLEPYPFFSFDSTGWQRDAAYSNAARWPFNRCSKDTRLKAYIEATDSIAYRPARQTSLFRITRKESA